MIAAAAATPFALAVVPALARAGRRDVRAADVRVRGHVQDAQRRSGEADGAGPGRVSRQGAIASIGRGTTPTLRLQRRLARPGRFRGWEKVLVWSHWVWFAFPHGTVAYVLIRHRDQFPAAAARIYATFDLGVIGYWAIPTAPPWFAAQRGLMEDGRTPELRRMMVEYGEQFWKQGWAPLYGVLGGNPLAAMPSLHFATSVTAAHVLSDTGPRRGRARLDLRGHARPRARLSRRALRRRSRRRPRAGGDDPRAQPQLTPASRALTKALQVTRGQGAGMTRAPEQTVDEPAAGDAHEDDDDRGLELNGRTVLTLCGFLAAMILGLYFLLPQLAGLEDTWKRIEDGSPGWIVLAFVLTFGMFGGYVAMFRGVFGHVERIGWRESYLITMAGLAASPHLRRGRRRRARPAGLGAPAGRACASARSPDKTISFLVLTYFPYAAAVVICGLGLRLGIFPGEAPFTMTVIPAVIAADPDGAHEPDPARPDRPAAAARRLRQAHRDARADHEEAGDDPRRDLGRPARRAPPHPVQEPRAARRDPVLGLPDRGARGPRSARSATRRRSRC